MSRHGFLWTATAVVICGTLPLSAQRAPAPRPATSAPRAAARVQPAWHLTAAGLMADCRTQIATAKRDLARILASPDAPGALIKVEDVEARAANATNTEVFLFNVASDAALRDSSTACGQAVSDFAIEAGADPRIYQAAQHLLHTPGISAVDRQLATLDAEQARHAGAALDSATRVRTTAMLQRLSDLERDYAVHIGMDASAIRISKAEAEGLSPQFVAQLKPAGDSFALRTNESTVRDFLATERSPDARRRFLVAYANRGDTSNVRRLAQAVALRDTIAHLFNFPTWAAYQLDVKMAQTPERVFAFLDKVDTGLLPKAHAEFDRLAALAARDGETPLQPWDVSYYTAQLKRTDYNVDDQVTRQYFPVDYVVPQVMAIYEQLLGLRFTEVTPADAWAPDVRRFDVFDVATGARQGVFYLDLFPRANKYGHFADFGLVSTRRLADGSRELPVTAVVGNWPLGAPGKPATLTHGDVVIFFHEFGHAMSAICDKSPYITTGAGDLRQDFVEALSQMLENWMWDPAVLARISRNVVTGKPLPDSLARKMIALKHLSDGLNNTAQAFYATYDMKLHTAGAIVQPVPLWNDLQHKLMVIPPIEGTMAVASFAHLMGGYDAGYYGYLWSLVYAQDLFTRFQKDGVMNAAAGRAYRTLILAPGATAEPDSLLQHFLGRPLSYDAFFREVGITNP